MAVGRTVAGGRVRWWWTGRGDGDLAVAGDEQVLALRRVAVAPTPWTWLRQVHGTDVILARSPGEGSGSVADAVVTTRTGVTLAVHTADCCPVLLWSLATDGAPAVVAAAHAGWRGLYDGVLQATVAAMRDVGAIEVGWALGPHISAAAYEFGMDDLTTMALRYGPGVVAATSAGAPALDLSACVLAALDEVGIAAGPDSLRDAACTATAVGADGRPGYFSFRARGEVARQAGVIRMEP